MGINYFHSSISWLVAGDFSIACSQEEEIGDNLININETNDFNDMINQAGLFDGGFFGRKFTWSNNRMCNARILQRLDRAILCSTWISSYTSVLHLHRANSYYGFLFLSY